MKLSLQATIGQLLTIAFTALLVSCDKPSEPNVQTPVEQPSPTATPTPAPVSTPAPPPTATPTPTPEPRLSEEGEFFLLERVSIVGETGVMALEAGKKVTLVRMEDGELVVTDGRAEIKVPADKLTRDLDQAEAIQAAIALKKAAIATTPKPVAQQAAAQQKQNEIYDSHAASLRASQIRRLEAAVNAAKREADSLQEAYQKSIGAYRQDNNGNWHRKSDTGSGSRPDSVENRARQERISKLRGDIGALTAEISKIKASGSVADN
jgi:hypothetical protein